VAYPDMGYLPELGSEWRGQLPKSSAPMSKTTQLWSVAFGHKKRERVIRTLLATDPTTGLMGAAVHFEWTLRRTILILGKSPTKSLREELDKTFKLQSQQKSARTLSGLWRREVVVAEKHVALGKVVTKLSAIQNTAAKARGAAIHGNGVLSSKSARESAELYLQGADQLGAFVRRQGSNIDGRLKARRAVHSAPPAT
jgi:hypothetical protein